MKSLSSLIFLAVTLLAAPCFAEETFEQKAQPIFQEFRTIMKANEGKAAGKCDDVIEKLKALKPDDEDGRDYQSYLGMMGELLFVNGNYAAAATYMRASLWRPSGDPDYNFGVWNKIVEAIYRSAGKKVAWAEYKFALSQVKGDSNQYTFETEVGSVLMRLDKELDEKK